MAELYTTNKDNTYLTQKDIQELLKISRTSAYRIMQQLNKELVGKGYIVMNGRVSKKYLEERLYY